MHRIQSKQQGQGFSKYSIIFVLVTLTSFVSVGFLDSTVRSYVPSIESEIADSNSLWKDCRKRSANCYF